MIKDAEPLVRGPADSHSQPGRLSGARSPSRLISITIRPDFGKKTSKKIGNYKDVGDSGRLRNQKRKGERYDNSAQEPYGARDPWNAFSIASQLQSSHDYFRRDALRLQGARYPLIDGVARRKVDIDNVLCRPDSMASVF